MSSLTEKQAAAQVDPVAFVLREAVRILEPKGAWIKDHMAVNHIYEEVPPSAKSAAAFCSIGAISRAVHDYRTILPHDIRRACRRALQRVAATTYESVESWNDWPCRTHADVLAAFNRAIAKREAAP